MTENPSAPTQIASASQAETPASSAENFERAGSDTPPGVPRTLHASSEAIENQTPARCTRLWSLPLAQTRFFLLALSAVAVILFLRLYRLDRLQAEMYGDISIVYEYVAQIFAGNWPFRFELSAGPLYHYLIVPVVALAGTSYLGLKLASVAVSLGVLAATYALAWRLVDDYFALLATFIAGVSSWLLIFSRLGNSQIVVPLLATCALWLAVRAIQLGHTADLIACAVVSSLGLYAYPQSFVLAPTIGLTLLCLRWSGQPVTWRMLVRFALVVVLCSLPFGWIVSRDPQNFFSGYIGGKLAESQSPLSALIANTISTLLELHVRGDTNFRSNPSELPFIDSVSGILFLAGLVFWLRPARRRWVALLLVPLFLLQLPALLVLSRPIEVPSASRTLGVAPIVYILVASGLWWVVQAAWRLRRARWVGYTLAAALLLPIVLLNAQRYFLFYLTGLPYQNTPIGRLVADYTNLLPSDTQVYLVGCCWESSMPEPKGIQYSMAHPTNLHLIGSDELTCKQLQSLAQPAVLIWSFHTPLPDPQIAACSPWLPAELYSSAQGLPAFYAAPLRTDLGNVDTTTFDAQLNAELEQATTEINGSAVEVHYSPLDIGQPADLFDGNRDSLIRGRDANPMVLELHFAQPRTLSQVALDLATMPSFRVTVMLTTADGTNRSVVQNFNDLPADPHVELPLGEGPQAVALLRIEIFDRAPPTDPPHIHVRELQLR